MSELSEIIAAVKEMDPGLDPDDSSFKTQVMLISFFSVGCNPELLSKFCKLPLPFVQERIARLKENGIVKSDFEWVCHWEDQETGGTALIMDALVAEGQMEKDDGEHYRMTDSGFDVAEKLLKASQPARDLKSKLDES